MNSKTLTKVAMIAAIYTVVSLVLAPLSFGKFQVRVAEALTLLSLIFPPAIWGVTLGCALTNWLGFMMGVNLLGVMDIFVGTTATFLAALGTYYLRNKKVNGIPLLAILMPVIFNAIIIGAELAYVFTPQSFWDGYAIFALEVGVGELLACFVLGVPLIKALEKTKLFKEV